MWQGWLDMADKSLYSAGQLLKVDSRSSASRYYYASYQAISCLLIYAGVAPPADREAWSHADTPNMLVVHLARIIPNLDNRNDMRNRLERLYKVRISADYISQDDVSSKLDLIRKDAEFLVKVTKGVVDRRRWSHESTDTVAQSATGAP